MAKRKEPPEPPKPDPGIILPLNHSKILDSWLPADEYSSHRPMLYRVIMNTPHKYLYEFGIGSGSTPLLQEIYNNQFPERDYYSFENDWQYFSIYRTREYMDAGTLEHSGQYKNHYMTYTDNLMKYNVFQNSVVFIDSAPGEQRAALISKHASKAGVIVVHDTEPGAEYVYQMADQLSKFRFRLDLVCNGMPQTTAVSNYYNFELWRGAINDQIEFL